MPLASKQNPFLDVEAGGSDESSGESSEGTESDVMKEEMHPVQFSHRRKCPASVNSSC